MKRCLCAIWLVLVVSCVSKELPKNVLDKGKMAEILLDMYIGESKLNNNRELTKFGSQLFPLYKDSILKIHNITDSTYEANMIYYIENPRHLEEIYTMVIDSLNLRKQTIDSKEK